MIERATKCLHQSGKTPIVLLGKDRHIGKPLHSFFWTHGAGDIDLPAWWNASLQQPDFLQTPTNKSSYNLPCTVRSNFLDFLYPPKTVEYVRSLGLGEPRNHRTARQRLLPLGGKRNYRRGSLKSQKATTSSIDRQPEENVPKQAKEEADVVPTLRLKTPTEDRKSDTDTQFTQSNILGIGQDDVLVQWKGGSTVAKKARADTPINDSFSSVPKSQMIEQFENLEMLKSRGIAELNKSDMTSAEAASVSTDAEPSDDLSTSTLKDIIDEAASILNQAPTNTNLDLEATIEFWRGHSRELAEAYTRYLNAVEAANAMPQVKDEFMSTFAHEAPVVRWQLEHTLQAGLAFLTVFMKHLYSAVLPVDHNLWSDKQWSFLIRMTFVYPKRGVEESQPLVSVNIEIPAGIKGTFALLQQAFAAGKGTTPARDLFKLALSRGQIDFMNSLLQFCEKQGLMPLEVVAGVETLDAPSLVRDVFLVVKRIKQSNWLRMPGLADNRIQRKRRGYLDIINMLTARFMRKHVLSPDVNIAAYQEIWTILLKYNYLEMHQFVKLLDQLIAVESSNSEELAVFAHFAYKIFLELRQRPDFKWTRQGVKKLLKLLMRVHHPQFFTVFEYYKSEFGFNSKIYKIVLPELSHTGEAERWQQVYKEIELGEELEDSKSKEKLDKFELFPQLLIAYSKRADIATCRALLESGRKDMGRELDLRSWNAVLHSYIQGDDMNGALEFYQYMQEQGVKPDVNTAMVLLRGYSSRGETALALEQAARVRAEGSELTPQIIEMMIHCHLVNDDMDSAEQLLYDTNSMDMHESKTKAWNMVLKSYAHKGRLTDMNYVHGLMHEYGIKENASTYAAMMLGFSMANLPSMAFRILSKIMPMHNMAPTIEHYNILLAGLVRRAEYDFALKVYSMLRSEHIKPDAVTCNLVVQALSFSYGGLRKGDLEWHKVRRLALARADNFLQKSLEDRYQHAVSPSGMMGSGRSPLDQAYASLHFSFLIQQHAILGNEEQMHELSEQYVKFYTEKYPRQKVIKPPTMLAAMGRYYLTTHNTDGIVHLWEKALETVKPFAASIGADTNKPGWVSRSRSMLLSPIFRIRMIDLMRRQQCDELNELVESLVTAGWRFPDLIWNIYVRFLAEEGYTELAFKYCEQYLIDGFPGWPEEMQTNASPKRKIEGSTVGSTSERMQKPTYEVLCWLTKSYIDFRKKHAFSLQRVEVVAGLWEIAPKSLEAVTYMPRVDDVTQGRILRGEPQKTNMKHKRFRRP
ncbi:MAG: hypothetical protein GOMPHAMPRED_007734 [Gomphillus americanus]|uniref:Pentatricopeptide repeat-containing protein n=1 Tax=Gomphillus americanus TaxID=1940652 RepID=A0A8H3EVV6_9LECA|nr:MAG: hypothetical protein GOMPHAMPRED_007734 [Gomphillus americanus]